MALKGGRQYTNPVRAAIARTSGLAGSGSRVSASNRIKGDSELRRASGTRNVTLMSNDRFLDRLGVPKNKRNDVSFRPTRGTNNQYTVNRHRTDRRDPNTGFGMNVTQIRRVKVTTSGS